MKAFLVGVLSTLVCIGIALVVWDWLSSTDFEKELRKR